MRRGFVFMLDAFISLLIVVAFVGMLNQYSRDYSYIQDEALYSYGSSIMNILLNKEVDVEVSNGVSRKVPLIHALSGSNECESIKDLVPAQYGISIDYYDGSGWESLCRKAKTGASRSVAVVSTIPVIVDNEYYTTPYKYGDYCDPGPSSPNQNRNACALSTDLYAPDRFATADSNYANAFVRVVVSV